MLAGVPKISIGSYSAETGASSGAVCQTEVALHPHIVARQSRGDSKELGLQIQIYIYLRSS